VREHLRLLNTLEAGDVVGASGLLRERIDPEVGGPAAPSGGGHVDDGGGNWRGPPRPKHAAMGADGSSYNRCGAGKWIGCREGVGGGRSTDRAVRTTQPQVRPISWAMTSVAAVPRVVSLIQVASRLTSSRGKQLREIVRRWRSELGMAPERHATVLDDLYVEETDMLAVRIWR
jgi:hypothetical protein